MKDFEKEARAALDGWVWSVDGASPIEAVAAALRAAYEDGIEEAQRVCEENDELYLAQRIRALISRRRSRWPHTI